MSTLGWVDGDYKSTWVYRSAIESGVHSIVINVRESMIVPEGLAYASTLEKSLSGLNEQFDAMLISQNMKPEIVTELIFEIEIPNHSNDFVHLICKPSAVDHLGNKHMVAPIEIRYRYEIQAGQ